MARIGVAQLIGASLSLLVVVCIARPPRAPALMSPDLAETTKHDAPKRAPESLEIKVLSVKTDTVPASTTLHGGEPGTAVTIRASVTRVRRSKSGVKRGAAIEITYTNTPCRGCVPGPTIIPVLDEGKRYAAYLVKEAGKESYRPAADVASFAALPN